MLLLFTREMYSLQCGGRTLHHTGIRQLMLVINTSTSATCNWLVSICATPVILCFPC